MLTLECHAAAGCEEIEDSDRRLLPGRKDERPGRFLVGQIELHIQLDPGVR
jgi:hypothetical protein